MQSSKQPDEEENQNAKQYKYQVYQYHTHPESGYGYPGLLPGSFGQKNEITIHHKDKNFESDYSQPYKIISYHIYGNFPVF